MKIHDECVTAKRASSCQNIVKTYDVADINNGNTVIIVMEYVNGVSLNNYLAKVGNINVKEALFIFEKILEGIKELHGFQHKIIHRDLKPENIMLTNDMTKIKIIDFGISSVLTISKATGDKKALTDETSVFGSFPYMCPETLDVARSTKEMKSRIISEQFDFFSLGVILYEMLIGQKPFSYEKEDPSICRLPLQYDLMCISDINPEIPVAVENIIFKCMASKPEDKKNRYRSVDEIIHDVRAVINGDVSNDTVQLLKPRNERTFQGKIVFNVNAQRLKEKFYEKQWFYWLMFSIAMIVALLIIVISLLHD
ncbi:putative serine/threonine-protein kinase [Bacilli bacterium]|nr:putative serine/threonine-protein kinase [Bacilli bacterium]